MDNRDLNDLLAKLDKAFESGDIAEITRINAEIYKNLGNTIVESSLDLEFINSIKDKAVYKNLKKFINGVTNDKLEVIKLLSSLVTHMTIECQIKGQEMKKYPIKGLINAVDSLVYGEVGSLDEYRQYLREKYEKYM
jgi:hypothetical protein